MINNQVTSADFYYNELRIPLLSLTKGKPAQVLEIGCGAGQTLAYFKAQGSLFVAGVEISPEVAEMARACKGVDEIICGNIENLILNYPENSFDLMVAGHILEHLIDPWEVLKKLYPLLKPGGQLLAALPNVRHYSVVMPLLLKGKWEYKQNGIMDWTHLRFFTHSSILKMFNESGFEVEKLVPEFWGSKTALGNKVSCGRFQHLMAYAYNLSAIKLSNNSI